MKAISGVVVAVNILAGGAPSLTAADRVEAVEPPAMPRRVITPSEIEAKGEQVTVEWEGIKGVVYFPEIFSKEHARTLTIHFHGTPWFVIQEHARRGAGHPLLCFDLGQGSSVYRRHFEEDGRFIKIVREAEVKMGQRLGQPDLKLERIEVSSFSAGYGAVRELMKQPDAMKIIDSVVLADSMYASLADGSPRHPADEHIEPWLPFARAAMRGEKTFVLTYSEVPTQGYASSSECAAALIQRLGLDRIDVAAGTTPASSDPEFSLLSRADERGCHIWGYDGNDAQAHMTHARHLADIWKALGK